MIECKINGQTVRLPVDPTKPLLWVLREDLNLMGTKYGCGIGNCGACSVIVNGNLMRSCVLPVEKVVGQGIITIEGLAQNKCYHPLQENWIAEQVPQCGYCQSGMLLAAAVLLNKTPRPTRADIRGQIKNICRCGTYSRVEKAILKTAAMMNPDAQSPLAHTGEHHG